MSELEKLKAQNAELSDRIAKLEEAAKPPKPFVPTPMLRRDLTEGANGGPGALQAMIDLLPPSFYSDLRADARKPNPVTGGPPAPPTPQGPRGSGWVEPRPLESPPGVALADKLVDSQDKLDLIDRARDFAKVAAVEQQATKPKGGTNEK